MAKKDTKTKKQLVLDIGAGDNPQPEATHAIDVNKPVKVPTSIEEYRVQSFLHPPKEWKGKFDKVVSEAALGASDSLEGSVSAGKALDFVTKPNATLKANVDISSLKPLMHILDASSFGVTKISAKEVPAWVFPRKDVAGEIIVEAEKGYQGTAKERRINMRFPVEFGELRLGKRCSIRRIDTPSRARRSRGVYADKGQSRMSRKPHRNWRRIY